jgi:hypothetical protein
MLRRVVWWKIASVSDVRIASMSHYSLIIALLV